ncbi:hypothetical protein IJJ12_03620 [bacterium]|nr:hypothetical protein [bacterium]
MQFNVQINREWDQENFESFWKLDNPTIKRVYPWIKSKQDIETLFASEYDSRKILAIAGWFLGEDHILRQIADALSDVIQEDWQGHEIIDIYVGVCPVCPRYINGDTFWVYYGGTANDMRRLCAHEMAHFLYFKKLKTLLHQDDLDVEQPGYEWLLSEILNVPIINDQRIQDIVHDQEQGYFFSAGVPDSIAQKVQAMWHPDKMLEIHQQAHTLLQPYIH